MTRPVKLTLAALILVCAGSVPYLPPAPGWADHPVARLSLPGDALDEIDLTEVQSAYSFTVTGKDGLTNTVLVEPGRIRVERADCPDQICVKHGPLTSGGGPIVCLPNRLSIEWLNAQTAVDAVSGDIISNAKTTK